MSVVRYIMTLRNFIVYFILTTLLFSCNRLEDKAKQLGNKAKSKSKQLVDTAINKILSDQELDSFSIRSIVKDFQDDKSITEIKGIQTDNNFFFTEYCVYTGQKMRVLKGIDKIIPEKVNDITSDDKCYPVTTQIFYHDIAPYEKNKMTTFFWNFEKLKEYEVYTCIKAPFILRTVYLCCQVIEILLRSASPQKSHANGLCGLQPSIECERTGFNLFCFNH